VMYTEGKNKEIQDIYMDSCIMFIHIYGITRKLEKDKISDSDLNELQSQIYEATYLWGVFDFIAQSFDKKEKILSQQYIIEVAHTLVKDLDICPEEELRGIMQFPLLYARHPEFIRLMTAGAITAENALIGMQNHEDKSVWFDAMNLNYFEDKELVSDFKNCIKDMIW